MSRPATMDVLELLVKAGDAGLDAGEIGHSFDRPENYTRRMSWANGTLAVLWRAGRARRSDRMGKSSLGQPCWRWYITEEGVRYWESGGHTGRMHRNRQARARQEQERRLRREHLAEVRASARLDARTWNGCFEKRASLMRQFREDGLNLREIGELFGVSRERARQVLAGINPSRCRCPLHAGR